jgi:hypothetical protein
VPKRSRKRREDPVLKLARLILPPEQIAKGPVAIRDVANHSEAEQRHSVRSGETRTIRKLTRVEQLAKAGVITADQAMACEWYVTAHELGFQTVGCTANYMGAGGSGFGSTDLLARYKAQREARESYFFARAGIPEHLVDLFEHVVLGRSEHPPHMMKKADKLRFSLAAWLLHGQVGHLLAIAA